MENTTNLVPFEERHLERVLSWANTESLTTLVGTVWPITWHQHRAWYASMQSDRTRVTYAIERGGEHVGMIGLTGIDLIYRNAELWLYLGESTDHRSGIGSQAVSALLDFAFGSLGLHRVYAQVFAFNEPALRFFPACGFQPEGVLRDAVFKRQRYWDKHVFGVLATEHSSS